MKRTYTDGNSVVLIPEQVILLKPYEGPFCVKVLLMTLICILHPGNKKILVFF